MITFDEAYRAAIKDLPADPMHHRRPITDTDLPPLRDESGREEQARQRQAAEAWWRSQSTKGDEA